MPELKPAEVAFLAGHTKGLANATIAALASRDILTPEVTTGRILRLGEFGPDAAPIEKRLYGIRATLDRF